MQKMKYSGVEWIGEIPEDWEITTYRRLLNRRKKYDDQDKQVLSLTIQGVKVKNENYGKMAEDFTGHQIVKQGDLVFTPRDFDATPILSGIAPCDGCISNLYFVLYPHNISETFIPFINYFMWGVKWGGDIWKRLSYGMRFSYNFQQFGALPIAVPPIDTQRRIADFLDDKCGKIDRYIEKQQQIIDKLKEYKQAVITETVTKGLDPDAPMKDSGIEWIGMIPEHWNIRRLRYLGSCLNGISKGGEFFGDGFPFVSYGDVYRNMELPQKVEGLVQTTESEREWYSVKEGDVFFTRTSETIEDVAIASTCMQTIENATFAGFLIRFRPNTNLLTKEFSKFYFRSDKHRLFFVKEMNLVTRASLSQELLKRLPILLPPIKEQQEIAHLLESKCSEIDSAISKQTVIIEKLTGYKKSLIYEAVTGKLEV